MDSSGNIMLANNAAERMFGHTIGELKGMSVENLMPENAREQHWIHRDLYRQFPRSRGMGTDLDLVARKKGGKEFPVDVMLSPLRGGEELKVICIMRDVTEQKSNELAARNLLRQLQDERQNLEKLHGLLPICAWYKKIRDDDRCWKMVEDYFQEHGDIDFTHGICPDCSRTLSATRTLARSEMPKRIT